MAMYAFEKMGDKQMLSKAKNSKMGIIVQHVKLRMGLRYLFSFSIGDDLQPISPLTSTISITITSG
jgi:hypothetical protein